MTGNAIAATYRLALVAALWTALLAHSCAPEPVHAAPQLSQPHAAQFKNEDRPTHRSEI